ncbi:hypothetical protein [Streptomyces roseolilacinus]|uniref:Uncharacterized protein n=1 Tax=Streptomyces roseolilacinus TaxID=66904 RepID=A0A918B044_9ACTN|nr:hypothetical protein [Streptomyces roseolilacinus]GGQ08422.1 hypothetical protein GCM10010249_28540 [Streptomyces roseolilacinus]
MATEQTGATGRDFDPDAPITVREIVNTMTSLANANNCWDDHVYVWTPGGPQHLWYASGVGENVTTGTIEITAEKPADRDRATPLSRTE